LSIAGAGGRAGKPLVCNGIADQRLAGIFKSALSLGCVPLIHLSRQRNQQRADQQPDHEHYNRQFDESEPAITVKDGIPVENPPSGH
jgi:hypothetical protein